MTDLFPETVSPPAPPKQGRVADDSIQALAVKQPGWRAGAYWYLIEVINPEQIMITGDIPIGVKKDGSPKWARGKDAKPCRVVIGKTEYRAAMDEARTLKSSDKSE